MTEVSIVDGGRPGHRRFMYPFRLGVVLASLLVVSCANHSRSQVPADPLASLAPEERVARYQDMLLENGEDALTHFRLGNAYYDMRQMSQAIDEYRKAVELDPEMASALGNLGAAYEETDQLDEALEAYRRAVEVTPKDAPAHSNLGSVYYAMGRSTEAVNEYRKALDLDPTHAEAHYNLGVAFADARIYKEAIREWQTVLDLDPQSTAGKNAQKNITLLQNLRRREEIRRQTSQDQ